MKKLRWQLIIIFLTGLVVGILLLSEQPGVIAPLINAPTRGGVYTEALVGSPQRYNPLLDFYNAADRDVDRLLFSGLVRFDGNGIPQPDLAESWGISKDGTVYNFALRSGARWHDGEPVTSNDVLFTIERMREPGSVAPGDLQAFWQQVEVVVLSPDTLQFKLPEAFAPFLDYLTFGIVPEHLLAGMTADQIIDASFNLEPVGCGPFRFNQFLVENGQIVGVKLDAFEDYYSNRAYLDQIVFRYYPDSAAAFQAYQRGEVQGISMVSVDVLGDALAQPDLSVYTGRMPQLSMVLFNLQNPETPFFQDADIREALLMGINRQWIIDHILASQAFIANGPILPGTWAYYDGLTRIPFDPEKAGTMLRDAGYVVTGATDAVRVKDGIAMSFTMLYPDDDLHRAIAEAIQKNWAQLSVQVTLEPLPYEVLVGERLDGRDYQAALVDLNLARTPDPDPYPFWDQAMASGGQNYSQWDSRLASEYLEQARITVDLAERARLYRNFQVIFEQELPALPLFYPVYNYAVDGQILGVRMGPLFDSSDRFVSVTEWYINTTRRSTETIPVASPTP